MKTILGIVSLAWVCVAQTTINGGRVLTGNWDASGATSSRPAKTSAALPSTCAVGEQLFLTTATPGNNLYLCTSANTWTPSLAPQLAQGPNQVLAGPASGTPALPGYRGLIKGDLPATTVHTDQSNFFSGGSQDMSQAGPTLPARVGATLPSTCSQGEFFFLSTAVAGKNVYICYAVNNWSAISGSGGGGGVSGGVAASVPICNTGSSGQVYYPSDSPFTMWCDGTTWDYRLTGVPVAPPNDSLFSWFQQSGATITVSGGTTPTVGDAYMLVPAGASNSFLPRARVVTNAFGNNWTLTAAIAMSPGNAPYGNSAGSVGLMIRNTGNYGAYGGAYAALRVGFGGPYGAATLLMEGRDQYNGVYAGGSSLGLSYLPVQGVLWLRMHGDGTNIVSQYSSDWGQNWYTVAQFAITTITGTPGTMTSQAGWFVSSDNTAFPSGASLLHWTLVNH